MLDVTVSQIVLDQPDVCALVGQGIATGMAEHMGVHCNREPSLSAIRPDQAPGSFTAEGPPSLADEERLGLRMQGSSHSQPGLNGVDFVAAERMRGGEAMLQPGDMQDTLGHGHLGQPQPAGLRHAQPVPKQQEQQTAIARFMPGALDSRQQLVDVGNSQVGALVHVVVPLRSGTTLCYVVPITRHSRATSTTSRLMVCKPLSAVIRLICATRRLSKRKLRAVIPMMAVTAACSVKWVVSNWRPSAAQW